MKYTLVEISKDNITWLYTVEYDVKLYQVKNKIGNFIYVQLNILRHLLVNVVIFLKQTCMCLQNKIQMK